ncbi:MAG: UDP-glucose 4-epimerase GalE [Trueperaceae bacterium]|nr:UDP-glucose 4-epimerase GalE [Trueperaceae bacterium]
MNVLVTGGAGYIGTHTCIELQKAGHNVVVIDNLCNSKQESIRRVQNLTQKQLCFYEADVLDSDALDAIFSKHKIDAVIHFAALKAVGESVSKPLEYYHNNIAGTLNLAEAMNRHGVKNIVFSSSATVYGDPKELPITEASERNINEVTNPYGKTKLMMEIILEDLHHSDPDWNVILLRYFNPVGAHKSGDIGEDPKGIPNNLMPYVTQVAVGKRPKLVIHGNDYDTPDGTGVRDYIHVVDLAIGHVKALEAFAKNPGVTVYNLGTGRGYSVLEVVKAFEEASGKPIPYEIGPRRPGDIASSYADPAKAENELGWKAERGLKEMCEDSWRWQMQNPDGF